MIGSIQGGGSVPITGHHHGKRFKKLDTNGDGGLDQNELGGLAKRTGKDAAQLMSELDTNKDGKVDFGEMDAASAKRKSAEGSTQGQGSTQFTTTMMKIMVQLKSDGSGQGENGDGDGCMPGQGATAKTGTANASASSQNSNISEFTTALMKIFKQLQDSSQDADGTGKPAATDPASLLFATDASKSGSPSGGDDLMAELQSALQHGFSFSATSVSQSTSFQGIPA